MINLFGGITNLFSWYSSSSNRDGSNTIQSTVFKPINFYTVAVTNTNYSYNTYTVNVDLQRIIHIPTINYVYSNVGITTVSQYKLGIDTISYTAVTYNINFLKSTIYNIDNLSYRYYFNTIKTNKVQNLIGINYTFSGKIIGYEIREINRSITVDTLGYTFSSTNTLKHIDYVIGVSMHIFHDSIDSVQVDTRWVIPKSTYSYNSSNINNFLHTYHTFVPVTSTGYTYSSTNIISEVGKRVVIPTFNLIYHIYGLNTVRHISVKINSKSYNYSINELKIRRTVPIIGLPLTYTSYSTGSQYVDVIGRRDFNYINYVINIIRHRIIPVDSSYSYLTSTDILAKVGIYSIEVVSTSFSMTHHILGFKKQWVVPLNITPYIFYLSSIKSYKDLDREYTNFPKTYIITNNDLVYLVKDNSTIYLNTTNEKIYNCTTNDKVYITTSDEKLYLS